MEEGYISVVHVVLQCTHHIHMDVVMCELNFMRKKNLEFRTLKKEIFSEASKVNSAIPYDPS